MKVSESAAPSPASPSGEEWDEARLEAALAHLQEQHIQVEPPAPSYLHSPCTAVLIYGAIQLRQLRDTIPSLVRPMHSDHASPELVYAAFAKAATGAARSVKEFAALMRNAESKEIRTRANASEEQSGDGITGWLVTQHPDWLQKPVTVQVRPRPQEEEEENQATAEKAGKKVGEGVKEDVKEFQDAFPDVVVKLDAPNKMVEVYWRAPCVLALLTGAAAIASANEDFFQSQLEGASGPRQASVHGQHPTAEI